MPTVAKLEAVASLERHLQEQLDGLRKWKTATGRLTSVAFADDWDQPMAAAVSEAGPRLDAALDALDVEYLASPSTPHEALAERAARRVRPFDQRGGGYRDTVIWLTTLAAVTDADSGDVVCLISDDNCFYEGVTSAEWCTDPGERVALR